MSDIKMTESLHANTLNTPTPEVPEVVVESLNESSWLEADIENKLSDKLEEYAQELLTAKTLHEKR